MNILKFEMEQLMFLHQKYILGNELAQKMNMSISNISMFRNSCLKDDDMYTVRKMGNCNFINTKSHKLPQNFKNAIANCEFVTMHDKLPKRYIKTEYGITDNQLRNSRIIIGDIRVANKDFYIFDEKFIEKVQGRTLYVLNADEVELCTKQSFILGYVQLSKNRFLTWY